MEITRVEVGDLAQPLPTWKADHSSIAFDQPFPLQRLQHAIDVNSSQAGCICQLLLSHRQFDDTIGRKLLSCEPICELTKEMRDAASRPALPDVHDPLPEDGCFDQRRDQDGPADL